MSWLEGYARSLLLKSTGNTLPTTASPVMVISIFVAFFEIPF